MTPGDASTVTLAAALIAGLAGSGHCFGMCGGIAGALGMQASRGEPSQPRAVLRNSLPHVGRILGYATAGALCGLLGRTAQLVLDLARVGALLRIASGALLLLIAARLLFRWNALAPIERLGARLWHKLRPLTARESGATVRSALTLGFAWGWLPCGLVYSMLLLAAMSGSPVRGAGVMIAFGLGTLPSMLTSSIFAARMQRIANAGWSRFASAGLMIAFGVWTLIAPVQMLLAPHAHHMH